jgi:2'-5' RNA ligase
VFSESGAPTTSVIGVAIAIPDPWGSELQQWRQRFGDPLAEAIPTHVTLLPPTSVATDTLPAIEAHLGSVAGDCAKYDIHLRSTATFRPVSPVVFVQLAAGIGGCERTEALVRSGPLARELSFPYHPHVTVAHELPDEDLDRACAALSDYEARFTVTGFSLYEHLDGVWRTRRTYAFGR